MLSKVTSAIGPIESGYSAHLRNSGFSTCLSMGEIGPQLRESPLRAALSHTLRKVPLENEEWALSFSGALEDGAALTVLNLLAARWTEITMHVSEIIKEPKEWGPGTCEIAFTAPNDLINEMLVGAHLYFNFNLQLCGWLLDKSAPPEEVLEFKHDSEGHFTIPNRSIKLAFATSDDWDCVEFFSHQKVELLSTQKLLEEWVPDKY